MLQNQPQHTCSSFRAVISNLKTYYENKKQLPACLAAVKSLNRYCNIFVSVKHHIDKPLLCLAAVEHLADGFVVAYQDATLRVVCRVAAVYAHAGKVLHAVQ